MGMTIRRQNGADLYKRLADQGMAALEKLSADALAPDQEKQPVLCPPRIAAELVHRSAKRIQDVEGDVTGATPTWVNVGKMRQRMYTPQNILALQEHFGTRPSLPEPFHLCVLNYKGGVAKTTIAQLLAHALARKGYQVLAVDSDPQATLTQTLLGKIPDLHIETDTTLAPIYEGEREFVRPIDVYSTNWPTLDVVPANLALADSDAIARSLSDDAFAVSKTKILQHALSEISHNYDVIITDVPPTMGLLSLGALVDADGLLVPLPPRIADFASTVSFLQMVANMLADEPDLLSANHAWLRFALSMVSQDFREPDPSGSRGEPHEAKLLRAIEYIFGDTVLQSRVLRSAAITRAAEASQTLYEWPQHDASWKRAIAPVDSMVNEIEQLIQRSYFEREDGDE